MRVLWFFEEGGGKRDRGVGSEAIDLLSRGNALGDLGKSVGESNWDDAYEGLGWDAREGGMR